MKGRREEGRLTVRERERKIKSKMEKQSRRERKGVNFGMFCTICAPQIEREIAMCCWRVSVINLVSK